MGIRLTYLYPMRLVLAYRRREEQYISRLAGLVKSFGKLRYDLGGCMRHLYWNGVADCTSERGICSGK